MTDNNLFSANLNVKVEVPSVTANVNADAGLLGRANLNADFNMGASAEVKDSNRGGTKSGERPVRQESRHRELLEESRESPTQERLVKRESKWDSNQNSDQQPKSTDIKKEAQDEVQRAQNEKDKEMKLRSNKELAPQPRSDIESKRSDSHVKEEGNHFIKTDNGNYFGLDKNQFEELFCTTPRYKSFDEDIAYLGRSEFGGAEGVLQKLRTSLASGIPTAQSDPEDHRKRDAAFGNNQEEPNEIPHCCEFVWEGLGDLMIRILIGAAIFQIVVGVIPQIQETELDFVEGLSIVFAVVVVVSVGSIVNYTKEVKFNEIQELNKNMTVYNIKRSKQILELQEGDILVGDIVKLEVGVIIPADGLVLQSSGIKIDEASLTGETDLVEKESYDICLHRRDEEMEKLRQKNQSGSNEKHLIPSPLVLSGTKVEEGSGWFVALRVGECSESGKIKATIKKEKEAKTEKKTKQVDEVEKDNKKEGENKEGEGEEEDDEEEEKKQTPLEKKLDSLANDVSMFGLISAIITLIALFGRLINTYVTLDEDIKHKIHYERSNWFNSTLFGEDGKTKPTINALKVITDIIRIFILCIAIVVVAIPEGLPLAVTLSLAVSIGKMMEDNNFVREMSACEIMGGAEYICTDKTGTLTRNEMSVQKFFNCEENKDYEALTNDKTKREDPSKYFNLGYFEILKLSIVLNVESNFSETDEPIKPSKTDLAFIYFLKNLGVNFRQTLQQFYPGGDDTHKKRIPFNSKTKKMLTIIDSEKFETGSRVFLKGAAEYILHSCTHYIDPNTNNRQVLTDEKKNSFSNEIKGMASQTLRTLCVAYKDISGHYSENWNKKGEGNEVNPIEGDDFTLIGIFGIKDKLRDGVIQAITNCKKAGINVIMVTGDNIDTAVAIAKECGILTDEMMEAADKAGKQYAIEGAPFYSAVGTIKCTVCDTDFQKCKCMRSEAAKQAYIVKKREELKDDKYDGSDLAIRNEKMMAFPVFMEMYPYLKVIARSRAADKYTLVYGLRELDKVVAVTGDGTNDAQALSKADVGFAMGIAGTEIAKQASKIVIMDDNFATIVGAVKWGRNIYDNIRKFVQFQLTVNISACLIVFLSCCIGNETPLNAIQMLWVNMIMDSLGSLALATEPPTDELLDRPPTKKKEYIISSMMWKHIVFQSIIQLTLLLLLYTYAHNFLLETNQENINLAKRLFDCYGLVPGQEFGRFEPSKVIAGPSYFWETKYEVLPNATPKMCGDFFTKLNLEEAHRYWMTKYGSVQITVVFNFFVLYTLFNQINVRKIDDSFNIFHNLHKNFAFIVIILVELGLQAIIVQCTGIVFRVSVTGLDGVQWGICFGFAFIVFAVNILLKPIPLQLCFEKMSEKWEAYKAQKEGKENNNNKDEAKNDQQIELESRAQIGSGLEVKAEVQVNVQLNAEAKAQEEKKASAKRKPNSVLVKLRKPEKSLTRKGTKSFNIDSKI